MPSGTLSSHSNLTPIISTHSVTVQFQCIADAGDNEGEATLRQGPRTSEIICE